MKATHKILALISLAVVFACVSSAQPVIFTVVNGASHSALISPGSLVTIIGSNLSATSMNAASVPWPTSLGGVSVTVGGLLAPLNAVSPNQVSALIPLQVSIPDLTVVPLVITSSSGSSAFNVRLTRDAPAIFTLEGNGAGRALLVDEKFNPLDTVQPQNVAILYATGLGPVDASGHVLDNVDLYMGERKAQVFFAGLVPAYPGVYQVNVIAPTLATDRLYIRQGGWQSNIVDIGIQSGSNTANVQGTIDGLYPSSDPFFSANVCAPEGYGPCGGETFSIMLHAGTFNVSFDILPSATPFDVAAVGEAGGAIISIDPKAATYTAQVSTLTQPERFGDFHDSIVPIWDYANCSADVECAPFPASIIPIVRMDPFWARAAQMLPTPNTTTPPNAFLQMSNSIGGSHMVINGQNNSNLSLFGGIVQVPLGPYVSASSTFKLYVDGQVIDTKSFSYVPAFRCFMTGPYCWSLP